jgi:hypothetical protein
LSRHPFRMFGAIPQILALTFFLLMEAGLCAELSLDFWQDNRTYVWNTRLDCQRQLDHGLSWGFSSAINSVLIKRSVFSNNQDRWQEDGKVGLSLNYAFTRRLKIGARFSQDISSLEKRKVTSSEYGMTSEYEISGLKFVQVLGGKNISRRLEEGGRKDAGFNHRLTVSHSPQIVPGAETRISFRQTSSRLTNIPLLEREFDISFSKSLSEQDSLELFYREGWAKRKFYRGDLADSNISTQRRTQRMINMRSSAHTPLGIKLGLDFDFTLNGYRYSDRPTSDAPALTDNSFSSRSFRMDIQRSLLRRLALGGFYKYNQTEEDYADDQKDQEMKGAELGGNLNFQMSRADSLHLTASVGVTSFYAPQISARFNDRDILTVFAWGEYLHIFSPVFSLRLEGGFRNFHQIYISDRLSANNNHNQTYVISPSFTWKPHQKLELKQNYNIQANYIYYDYEKSIESTRNRLFRRGSSSTNLTCRVLPRVGFMCGYIYRYEDYGQLIWRDQWVQKPSWERRTHTFNIRIDYAPIKSLALSPEYTYERRKSWDHSTDLITEKRIRTLSDRFYRNVISVACKYRVNGRSYISLTGARREQKSTLSSKESFDQATVSVSWLF